MRARCCGGCQWRTCYSLFELIFLAVLAIQCARLIWAVVTPVSPLGDWRVMRPGVPEFTSGRAQGILIRFSEPAAPAIPASRS